MSQFYLYLLTTDPVLLLPDLQGSTRAGGRRGKTVLGASGKYSGLEMERGFLIL